MKNKKILRLEEDVNFSGLPEEIRSRILEDDGPVSLDQNQANWRVAIFRDEILDIDEYSEWLSSSEAQLLEEEQQEDYNAN
jgi:hypothetical protein